MVRILKFVMDPVLFLNLYWWQMLERLGGPGHEFDVVDVSGLIYSRKRSSHLAPAWEVELVGWREVCIRLPAGFVKTIAMKW